MRKAIVGLLLVASLLVPPAASAGGWATVGLSPSQPPDASGPGDRWVAEITVLRHGTTPLAGAEPVLTLTNAATGKRVDFRARPTGEIGVYRVVAKLPANGTWDVSVYDGFVEYGGAQTHKFAPITVGPADAPAAASAQKPKPAPAVGPDRFPTVPIVLAVAAALATAAILLARRIRKKAHAVA